MIKEKIAELAEDIENITESTISMCGCPLIECFPATTFGLVEINGEIYKMQLDVSLKSTE